mgnify:FL=1
MKAKITVISLVLVFLLSFAAVFAAVLPEGVPTSLETPQIKGIELKYHEDGKPYFEMQIYIPQSVLDLDRESPGGGSVFWDWSQKIDNGSWGEFGGGGYINVFTESEENNSTGITNTFKVQFDMIDEGGIGTTDIKNHTYSYKIHLFYDYYEGWPDIQPIYSPVSNEISLGSGSFYSDASSWAEAELKKANEANLIPAILQGADMTKPITREEFAELALVLYEKTSGISVEPVAANPFTDTVNPQILKALKIGVTQGTSATTFSPKVLINREQCATMLFRTIKAIAPDGDYSIDGIKNFPDQKNISEYAVQPTKYMSKLGIIKGDASTGNFMPKATTSAEQAAGYGMATREAAILMSVRTYDAMN